MYILKPKYLMTASLKSILLLLCIVYLTSCNFKKHPFEYQGKVKKYTELSLSNVDAYPNESYYIYVPSTYNKNEIYPLMLCFSPKAEGRIAVENLRFAAESFGYILVGSNVVKNNFDGNGVAIRNLIYDVQNKYGIDQTRMYACGFSGGARLATVLGNQDVLAGVISCSAGAATWSKKKPYPWYGIVGKSDFNYNEFVQFVPGVLQKPFYNTMFHDGGHEWPDSSYLYDAVAFLEIHAIKANRIDPDSTFLKGYNQYVLVQVAQMIDQKKYKDAFDMVKNATTLLSGLMPVNALIEKADQLYQSKAYKMGVAKRAELNKLYNELMKVYPAAITQKDALWWKNEMQKIDQRIDNASGEAVHTFKRAKAALGILCYSYSRQLVNKDQRSLRSVLEVYELLEPNNADVYYFWSEYEKKEGNLKVSNQYLERAKMLGYADF